MKDLTANSDDLDFGMVFVIGSEDVHCGNIVGDSLGNVNHIPLFRTNLRKLWIFVACYSSIGVKVVP